MALVTMITIFMALVTMVAIGMAVVVITMIAIFMAFVTSVAISYRCTLSQQARLVKHCNSCLARHRVVWCRSQKRNQTGWTCVEIWICNIYGLGTGNRGQQPQGRCGTNRKQETART